MFAKIKGLSKAFDFHMRHMPRCSFWRRKYIWLLSIIQNISYMSIQKRRERGREGECAPMVLHAKHVLLNNTTLLHQHLRMQHKYYYANIRYQMKPVLLSYTCTHAKHNNHRLRILVRMHKSIPSWTEVGANP